MTNGRPESLADNLEQKLALWEIIPSEDGLALHICLILKWRHIYRERRMEV